MNLLTLFTPHTRTPMAPGSSLRLPLFPSPRAIAGGLLLAATLASGLLAPEARAQEEPATQAQTVNINSADAEALSSLLSGIGQARAEAIIRYREMYGPFESLEELMDVSGVGEATLARNRERISLD